jgi:hypothetical protein
VDKRKTAEQRGQQHWSKTKGLLVDDEKNQDMKKKRFHLAFSKDMEGRERDGLSGLFRIRRDKTLVLSSPLPF